MVNIFNHASVCTCIGISPGFTKKCSISLSIDMLVLFYIRYHQSGAITFWYKCNGFIVVKEHTANGLILLHLVRLVLWLRRFSILVYVWEHFRKLQRLLLLGRTCYKSWLLLLIGHIVEFVSFPAYFLSYCSINCWEGC